MWTVFPMLKRIGFDTFGKFYFTALGRYFRLGNNNVLLHFIPTSQGRRTFRQEFLTPASLQMFQHVAWLA
jgi:hypothetical protein